jgi:hypothetical protein
MRAKHILADFLPFFAVGPQPSTGPNTDIRSSMPRLLPLPLRIANARERQGEPSR